MSGAEGVRPRMLTGSVARKSTKTGVGQACIKFKYHGNATGLCSLMTSRDKKESWSGSCQLGVGPGFIATQLAFSKRPSFLSDSNNCANSVLHSLAYL